MKPIDCNKVKGASSDEQARRGKNITERVHVETLSKLWHERTCSLLEYKKKKKVKNRWKKLLRESC